MSDAVAPRRGKKGSGTLFLEASKKKVPDPFFPHPGDTSMTATYTRVVILEAAILAALWLLGRAFS